VVVDDRAIANDRCARFVAPTFLTRHLEAVAVIAHSWPTSCEEVRPGDFEVQGIGDAIVQAEREADLRQVADRLVAGPGLTKTVQMARRDR
jgi:hypothetical protein